MGCCTPQETETLLRYMPGFEQMLGEEGVVLVKFWLTVTRGEERQIRHPPDRPDPATEAERDRHRAGQVGR